jgi:hypothetical protein
LADHNELRIDGFDGTTYRERNLAALIGCVV